MLSKCANPACSNTFRYLHEGKLYVIAPKAELAGDKPMLKYTGGYVQYARLCSSCCFYLAIQIDNGFGIKTVRKPEAQNGT
jgi:hypothetical protein